MADEQPLATYSDHIRGIRRRFRLYTDRLVVQGKFERGGETIETYRLNEVDPTPDVLRDRVLASPLRREIGLVLTVVFLIASFAANRYGFMRGSAVEWAVLPAFGIVALALFIYGLWSPSLEIFKFKHSNLHSIYFTVVHRIDKQSDYKPFLDKVIEQIKTARASAPPTPPPQVAQQPQGTPPTH